MLISESGDTNPSPDTGGWTSVHHRADVYPAVETVDNILQKARQVAVYTETGGVNLLEVEVYGLGEHISLLVIVLISCLVCTAREQNSGNLKILKTLSEFCFVIRCALCSTRFYITNALFISKH